MFARPLLFLMALVSTAALAEDLRTTDGVIYHRVKVVQVDPDGVVVGHDKGISKIDYRLLPPEVRQRFTFNERKAAIFHTQEKERAEQMAQENQRIAKEQERREIARLQKLMESSDTGNEISYGSASAAASEARLAAQIHKHVEAKQDALAAARQPRTFWNAPFWQSPVVQFLGGILGSGGGGSKREGPIGNGAGWDNHHDFGQ